MQGQAFIGLKYQDPKWGSLFNIHPSVQILRGLLRKGSSSYDWRVGWRGGEEKDRQLAHLEWLQPA